MPTPISLNNVLVTEAYTQLPAAQQASVQRRYWKVVAFTVPGVVYFGDVAAALDTAIAGRMTALIMNDANYLGVRCRRVYLPSNEQWEVATAGAGPGLAGAVALPTQSAGLVTLLSAVIGHAGEGRIYAPFPAAADNVLDGVPRAGYTTALASLAAKYTQQLIVAGGAGAIAVLDPVIFRPPGIAPTVTLTGYRVAPAWATQKRRGSYGRFNKPPF
jgi:hypothetical protein